VFRELMTRTHPERASAVGLADAGAIRQEIGAAVPLYAGIERLAAKGDQFQWGGPRLFSDGRFATPDGRAHFSTVAVRAIVTRAAEFVVSTRRGKQFNSMVQREIDPLTGLARHDILINPADLARIGCAAGSRVRLRSTHGTFEGILRAARIREGNLEVHWPEGNALLGRATDPESFEPDYNAVVTVEQF
jgi:predicted molibdopterin-dependent oxidoreductase YjgC